MGSARNDTRRLAGAHSPDDRRDRRDDRETAENLDDRRERRDDRERIAGLDELDAPDRPAGLASLAGLDDDPSRRRSSLPPPRDRAAIADRVRAATELLEEIAADRGLLAYADDAARTRLLIAAGRVARPDPVSRRRLARVRRRKRTDERRAADERARARTGIRALRQLSDSRTLPPGPDTGASADPTGRATSAEAGAAARVLEDPRKCYVCKAEYRELHAFYDALCPPCAALNWAKRHQRADLAGRVAVVTGARVKIGYQAALILLRSGAHVVVTTRFPRDAAARYAREPDFDAFRDRLDIYGLELRHTPSVEVLARHLCETLPRLDFLLNNACQTVRRPPGFYAHLLAGEAAPARAVPAAQRRLLARYETLRGPIVTGGAALAPGRLVSASRTEVLSDVRTPPGDAAGHAVGLAHAAELSQLALLAEDLERGEHLFPSGRLDSDLQQVDLRPDNSWRLRLADVPTVELLEVHLVNAVAPFVLAARLKPLMLRHPGRDKHVVNVSAMEGQFYRSFKTDRHPHTNMAKAALNMLTRTSAADYARDGIHMNSVDTGWITDEDPAHIAARKTFEHAFHPPLDAIDGAARICDPILSGFLTGEHVWGKFLKDYQPTDW